MFLENFRIIAVNFSEILKRLQSLKAFSENFKIFLRIFGKFSEITVKILMNGHDIHLIKTIRRKSPEEYQAD